MCKESLGISSDQKDYNFLLQTDYRLIPTLIDAKFSVESEKIGSVCAFLREKLKFQDFWREFGFILVYITLTMSIFFPKIDFTEKILIFFYVKLISPWTFFDFLAHCEMCSAMWIWIIILFYFFLIVFFPVKSI